MDCEMEEEVREMCEFFLRFQSSTSGKDSSREFDKSSN